MSEPLKIRKYKHPHSRLHGLEFSISKLHKIDDHLYSFDIQHPDCKYLSEINPISCLWNGKHWYELELVDSKGREEYTAEDVLSGEVLGGHIKLSLSKTVNDVLLRCVPLKWETTVFLIVDLKDSSIWKDEYD